MPDTVLRSEDNLLNTPADAKNEPTPSQIRHGLKWNIAAGCMTMIWLVLPGTPLTMLMECLHGDALYVGLLVGIQQAAMLFQIPGALLSGFFRRRKPFWAVTALLHRAVWFIPAVFFFRPELAAISGVKLMGIMVLVSSVLAQLSASSWHAWMADLIPERQRSRFWGTRQSFMWACYLPAVLLFGRLLDIFPDPRAEGGNYSGFALVFSLGALAGCLDIVLHLKVPEATAPARTLRKALWARIKAPFTHRDFARLTLAMAAWYFAIGLVGAFGILYLSRAFHMSYTSLAVLGASSSLAGIASGFLWGYLIHRVGARSFLISMLAPTPLMGLSWFFLRNFYFRLDLPWIGEIQIFQPLLLQAIFGFMAALLYAGVGLCQMNLLAVFTAREDRGIAMAAHWTAVGIGSALGPVYAGRIVNLLEALRPTLAAPQSFSFSFMHLLVLLHMAVVWMIVLPLIGRLRRQEGDLPVGVTLSGIFLGNPLRLMGNILMMDLSRSSRRHLRAIHRMGRRRFAPAVMDLEAQTRNPSSRVREAAVKALGRIASREAVDILRRLLREGDSLYTLGVLRALGTTASPRALPETLPLALHPNREIAREAIRTLGRMRDSRAIPVLRERIASTDNPTILSACAEALESLKDMSSAALLLERVPKVRHPVVKKNLAVVAANLLSAPETFYRTLSDELQYPGTLFDRLLNDITTAPPLFPGIPNWNRQLSRRGRALGEALARRDAAATIAVLSDFVTFLNECRDCGGRSARRGRRTRHALARREPAASLTRYMQHLSSGLSGLDATAAEGLFDCEIPLALHLLASALRFEKSPRERGKKRALASAPPVEVR